MGRVLVWPEPAISQALPRRGPRNLIVCDYFHHDVSQSHSTEKPHFRGSWFALWLTKGPDLIKDIEIMGDSIGVFLQSLPK